MKKVKKLVLISLMCMTLLMPTAAVANAADMFSSDGIGAFLQQFDIDLNDPESIQSVIDKIQGSGALGALSSIAGIDISGIVSELQEYLFAFEAETTTEPTTEPTTELTTEPTTEPTTAPPTTAPQYNYAPPVYSEVVTVPETTTFQYIPPEQIYTEAFTTTVFNPVIDDNLNSNTSSSNPLKTAAGIILLVGSGIGVFVVALALKRNRI